MTLQADPGPTKPCAVWALEVTIRRMRFTTQWRAAFRVKSFKVVVIKHWKFAFVAGIEAAQWRRSPADCAWWRRSSSSADDADCVSVRQRCLSRAVATSSVGGMPHHFKPAFTVSLKRLQGRPCLL